MTGHAGAGGGEEKLRSRFRDPESGSGDGEKGERQRGVGEGGAGPGGSRAAASRSSSRRSRDGLTAVARADPQQIGRAHV